jgi:hypothetical protein
MLDFTLLIHSQISKLASRRRIGIRILSVAHDLRQTEPEAMSTATHPEREEAIIETTGEMDIDLATGRPHREATEIDTMTDTERALVRLMAMAGMVATAVQVLGET